MERLICIECGKRKVKQKKKNGLAYYNYPKCAWCYHTPEEKEKRYKAELIRRKNLRANNPHKKNTCERCGFVPEAACQLDLDHIDGNHFNNSLDNLMTLCANCHRLKTWQAGDWDHKRYKNLEICP